MLKKSKKMRRTREEGIGGGRRFEDHGQRMILLLGRVGFSRGTWDPGSHEIVGPHKKSLLKLPHYVKKILAVFRRNENKKKMTVTGKNILARRNFLSNFVSQERILYCRKEFPATGKYFLSHEDNSCYRNKFAVTLTGINLPSQE